MQSLHEQRSDIDDVTMQAMALKNQRYMPRGLFVINHRKNSLITKSPGLSAEQTIIKDSRSLMSLEEHSHQKIYFLVKSY